MAALRRRTGSDDVTVSSVMSRDVLCVAPDMSLAALAELMIGKHVRSAPVCDERGRVIGVVSMSDLARGGGTTVGDVMMPFAFTLAASASLARAAALMAYEGIGRVVVVEPDGTVAGVVSAVDVMRWLARAEGYVVPGYTQDERVESAANRVLVVDDDPDIRDQLAEILAEEGYEVITAANGREALERLRDGGRPALILMDLLMPVMDGWALRAELERDPRTREIPVVLLSGQGNAREEATRLDAHACLVKPVPYPTLLGTVQKFCAA
ncbi:MAG TPA: CBS domain-containing protein [Kofleriaceae bacterium]|nr:CBS domain-containing protein [Kofleriaceae bacterium]